MRRSFFNPIAFTVVALIVCRSAAADTIVNRPEGMDTWLDGFLSQWHPTEEREVGGIRAYGRRPYDQFTLPQSATISRIGFQMAIGYSNAAGTNPKNPTDEIPMDAWNVSIWSDQNGEPSSERLYTVTIPKNVVTSDRLGINCEGCTSTFANWTVYQFSTDLLTAFHADRNSTYWLSVTAQTPAAQPGISWVSSGSTSDQWWFDTLAPDGSTIERFNPIFLGASAYRDRAFRLEGTPDLRDDFNGDGSLNAQDIDQLTGMLGNGDRDLEFHDLNSDEAIDQTDRRIWVTELKQTWYGDANLDDRFDSGDMVQVFQAGQYEDTVRRNSTWSTGDWNGDRDFGSGDLVLAFQDGGYEAGTRQAVIAVPEPAASALITLCTVATLMVGRRRLR